MLKFIKWVLILAVVTTAIVGAFVLQQMNEFQERFSQDSPLKIEKVELSPQKSQEVSREVTKIESGFIYIKEAQFDYLFYAFLNHPDIQAELNKQTKPLQGNESEWNPLDKDLRSDNIDYKKMKTSTKLVPGGGRVSFSAPYRNKVKWINIIVRFKGAWPAEPGGIRIESLRVGGSDLLSGGLINEKLKEGLDEQTDLEIAKQLADPERNALLRLEFVEGAARFKLKPKAQGELLRFVRNVLKGQAQKIAFPE